MALEVDVQLAVDERVPSPAQLRAWARAAWRGKRGVAEVAIRVTGEDEGRRLNREYRDKDYPTNVLSFPFAAMPGVEIGHLGDLVICAPVVHSEALQQRKTEAAHWAHMVVHGMLHLQGFDHETDEQAAEMEALEAEILLGLGYDAPYLDDERQ